MPAKQYREQVRTVHGLQFDGTNQQEIIDWAGGKVTTSEGGGLQVETAMGVMVPVNVSDWVYVDLWSNWWAMKDLDFQITFVAGPQTIQASI